MEQISILHSYKTKGNISHSEYPTFWPVHLDKSIRCHKTALLGLVCVWMDINHKHA